MRFQILSAFLAISQSSFVFSSEAEAPKKKILSLGGNGMIGAATLEKLIETNEYSITLASRGTWPYDTEEVIEPYVDYVECDRELDIKTDCPDLYQDIQDTTEYYAVLDFSGYEPAWIKQAIDLLKGKTRVYIYVSTDSVYEVSEKLPGQESRRLSEADAVRSKNETLQLELNALDDYGNEKLQCEELLAAQLASGGFPYVSLRYADVIGPRDASSRFSTYYIWTRFQYSELMPGLHISENVLESASVTFVEDAVWSINTTMTTPSTWNEAYNIACEEIFNVTNTIELIGKYSAPEDVIEIEKLPEEESFSGYPSVTRGAISVAKAVEKMGFKPTPLEEAIKITVEWFDDEFEDEESRENFLDEFTNDVLGDLDDDEIEELFQEFLDENDEL